MKCDPTDIPEVLVFTPDVYNDPRGFFMETYHEKRYHEAGLERVGYGFSPDVFQITRGDPAVELFQQRGIGLGQGLVSNGAGEDLEQVFVDHYCMRLLDLLALPADDENLRWRG